MRTLSLSPVARLAGIAPLVVRVIEEGKSRETRGRAVISPRAACC
jgi:hypothetical protein